MLGGWFPVGAVLGAGRNSRRSPALCKPAVHTLPAHPPPPSSELHFCNGLAFTFVRKVGAGLSFESGHGFVIRKRYSGEQGGRPTWTWSAPLFLTVAAAGLGLTLGYTEIGACCARCCALLGAAAAAWQALLRAQSLLPVRRPSPCRLTATSSSPPPRDPLPAESVVVLDTPDAVQAFTRTQWAVDTDITGGWRFQSAPWCSQRGSAGLGETALKRTPARTRCSNPPPAPFPRLPACPLPQQSIVQAPRAARWARTCRPRPPT